MRYGIELYQTKLVTTMRYKLKCVLNYQVEEKNIFYEILKRKIRCYQLLTIVDINNILYVVCSTCNPNLKNLLYQDNK